MKQEIHFVTGKGGVGKSIMAAALALKLSQTGKRVLLVELGEQSFYRDFFDLPHVSFQPTQVKPQLSVALWSGDTCLREYAHYLIKVESLTRLFFDNAVMRAFINVAPALSELAIVGKITSGLRNHGPALPFDYIVVDAFATGHFKALLEAPKGMAQAVQFGPMGEQSRQIDHCIRDKQACHYYVVTLPEELPLKEAAELASDIKSEFDVDAEIILNKMLNVNISPEKLRLMRSDQAIAPSDNMQQFIRYLEYHLSRQQKMKTEAEKITSKTQMLKSVPLFFETDSWKLVTMIAEWI